MTVVCAAVIGAHNNPLYLQTFPSGTDEEQLKFHYIVHCSLDAIEEKVAMPKRAPNEVNDAYLGLLFPTEDCSVYGYMGSTRVKIVLVLDKSDTKDQELRKVIAPFTRPLGPSPLPPPFEMRSPAILLLFLERNRAARGRMGFFDPLVSTGGSARATVGMLAKRSSRPRNAPQAFQQMHVAYANAIANPFHTAGQVRRTGSCPVAGCLLAR